MAGDEITGHGRPSLSNGRDNFPEMEPAKIGQGKGNVAAPPTGYLGALGKILKRRLQRDLAFDCPIEIDLFSRWCCDAHGRSSIA
ncbi:hypothetical protein GCM10011335_34780 [Aureimonas glaciei]|uniref:Uncharacterized protein n=1 Tax=Aureimonas glaciei TaxID=1776957 RepID=A0A916Y399_9HYPH|nr:hypothetical protein GCM10011335_34780 [Aureimonas glaciei]